MPHMGTFRLEFKKTIFIFEIKTLKFVKMQSFMLKKKNWGPKLLYIWEFLDWNLKKNYCRIWIQHARICQNVKFHIKVKNIKFRTKNTLFVSYLKSALLNLLKCKVSLKIKKLWFWYQKCLILEHLGQNLKMLLSNFKFDLQIFPNTKLHAK